MNENKYNWILYVIIAVIAGTIGIQVYWNYKNYEVNKQQLINEVQLSLDSAVEEYYAKLAEERTYGFAIEASYQDSLFPNHHTFDSIIRKFDLSSKNMTGFDSLDITLNSDGIMVYTGSDADSLLKSVRGEPFKHPTGRRLELNHISYIPDSIITGNLEQLTSKVVISLAREIIEIEAIDSLFVQNIKNKNLNVQHELQLLNSPIDSVENNDVSKESLRIFSKSPFLTGQNQIMAIFSNSTQEILKRGLKGILISTLLVLVVISCLFYLLKIIKHQKQLAEVKNDLISNITHEFKTPIATIGVALESIKDFNVINDKAKTTSYLEMSTNQLNKLNLMVEKLLETATLDSEELNLKKEEINIVELVSSLVGKHEMATSKEIDFNCESEIITGVIDIFHFENALNNVIDNAIKYGGDYVKVSLTTTAKGFEISVLDNGSSLTEQHKQKIFEKFYRIPKGNTHDVKGFGIGLYYTKKIIEKHGGRINLDLSNKLTNFKIVIPNE